MKIEIKERRLIWGEFKNREEENSHLFTSLVILIYKA